MVTWPGPHRGQGWVGTSCVCVSQACKAGPSLKFSPRDPVASALGRDLTSAPLDRRLIENACDPFRVGSWT